MATTRDQDRALHAYDAVRRLLAEKPSDLGDYKVDVNALGPNLMRSGLTGAMAWLERKKTKRTASRRLLEDLAAWGRFPGIPKKTGGDDLPAEVRKLDLAAYMSSTRELMCLATWFKRAVQAAATPRRSRTTKAAPEPRAEGDGHVESEAS